MKRLLALTGLILVLGATPAGALTQHNTITIPSSHSVAIANSGFNFSFNGGTIVTPPAIAANIQIVVISQSNSNP